MISKPLDRVKFNYLTASYCIKWVHSRPLDRLKVDLNLMALVGSRSYKFKKQKKQKANTCQPQDEKQPTDGIKTGDKAQERIRMQFRG